MIYIYRIFVVILWVCGFVIAKGFWSTLFCIIPFYAWYLTLERCLKLAGLI